MRQLDRRYFFSFYTLHTEEVLNKYTEFEIHDRYLFLRSKGTRLSYQRTGIQIARQLPVVILLKEV